MDQSKKIVDIFDQQAASYDDNLLKLAPINDCMYFLLDKVFSELPKRAKVLCVGAGTGSELIYLANKFPDWHFTVAEPSKAMLNICRERINDLGLSSKCSFHEGYVSSLPVDDIYDAATSFLVSQFILNQDSRIDYYQQIAKRLRPRGVLACADLSADTDSKKFNVLLKMWQQIMSRSTADISPEDMLKLKESYKQNVAILPSSKIMNLIQDGGFEEPTEFFQAGLMRAWVASKPSH